MNSQVSVGDFPVICRFCLAKSNELELISDIHYVNIFEIITGIEFGNILPEKICMICIQIFKEFSFFIENAKKNILKLKELLENSVNSDSLNKSDRYENNMTKKNIEQEGEVTQITMANMKSRVRHIKKKLICEKCHEAFSTWKKISEHQKKCIKKHTDDIVQKFTHSEKDVPTSLPNNFKCSECNKTFNKKYQLVTHMRSHTKETPFECRQCNKKFRFQQNLKRHSLIHKGVKPFRCEVCDKSFSRAHVKNEHMNIHTGHNPYICMYCGKGFKRYANHFIHVYRHKLINGEVDKSNETKLYLQLYCKICDKVFASRGGLENHLKLHQEEPREKKYLCNECGKGFATKSQIESHARIHTGDRPFACSICGKKFRQKSAYSIHKLVHSGEKRYKCEICNKLFTQSGHLKVHMRVHSGEKPFGCSFCGKYFALKSNLKVHTRTHTGETPYVCSFCGHGYYDSTSLKKHMKCHISSVIPDNKINDNK